MATIRLATAAQTVTVRLATETEGPLIGQLVRASGKPDAGLDWHVNVFPYWLLAEQDGAPVACVQLNYGVPVARVETLCLVQTLRPRDRVLVIKTLLRRTFLFAAESGAQIVTGNLDETQYPAFGKLLTKHFHARRIRGNTLYVAKVR